MKKNLIIALVFSISLLFAFSSCKTNRHGIVPCPCHGSIENSQDTNNIDISTEKI